MDESVNGPLTRAMRRGAIAVAALAALAVPAPGTAQTSGPASCYGGLTGADAAPAATRAAAPDSAASRTADAERALAVRDLIEGATFAAIERLERAGTGGAAAEAALALAYARAGCRAAFLARSGDAATLPDALGAELRARRTVAGVALRDSVAATAVPLTSGPADALVTRIQAAWAMYGRKNYAAAESAFAVAADSAPDVVGRMTLRLLAAQAALESGASSRAAAAFRAVLDSARALDALVAQRSDASAPPVTALAGAVVARRAVGLLWASDAVTGRLVVAGQDGMLRAMSQREVGEGFAALGAAAADAAARALAWTPGGSGLAELRLLTDSLSEADARVARGAARIARLEAERPVRLASVARYVATVRGMDDSLAVAARTLAALQDSVARRDSAIARTIEDYRRLIERKIADTRALARENLSRIDSLAPAARAAGALTARFLEAEQGTAAEYLALTDAADAGLERGLARLDIVFQRDSVHARRDRLAALLRETRVAFDSALASALADSAGLTAALDRVRAAADGELAFARERQSELEARAAARAAAVLAARVDALRARLATVVEDAAHGVAAALFFAALDADTVRAERTDVARRRDAAIVAATDALDTWPRSRLRPAVLQQLGELLTRRADAEYAAAQRTAGAAAPERPDYGPAMARFDELVRDFPDDPRATEAAYTLGTIALASQRYDDAARAFALVESRADSPYRAEAYFRDGDGRFEQASKLAGDERRARFVEAARAYEQAIALAPVGGDIYFLSLYKLGWSDYMQAERQNSDEYRRAVEVFARLVREVDALPPERQARLALRQEAIDYLAIAITQLGGPEEAVRYLGGIPDIGTRMLVLRRVAHALRDQGEFNSAIVAFRGALEQAPLHPAVLETRVELVELFQSRMLEPARAQEARLELIDALAPASPWAAANAARAADAAAAREKALREAGAYELAAARGRGGQGSYAAAARLFGRYLADYAASDSAARMSALEGDARFGAREWFAAGAAYARTAARWPQDSALAAVARRNAVVAFDSALVSARRAATDGGASAATNAPSPIEGSANVPPIAAIEDSLFAASERFAAGATPEDARAALVAMGRRASEARRWDVVADAFSRVAERWPTDPGAADARKFVADARYRQGRYADAQAEWGRAQEAATAAGRKGLADSIVAVRVAAAAQVADSLARRGAFVAAADSILAALAANVGDPTRAADLLRNAIEVHLAADSAARAAGGAAADSASRAARLRAIAGIEALIARYPGYAHAVTYGALRARLLSDLGRPADAAAALEALADANPKWPGRADAMVRAAVLLDSIGRSEAAAVAYEKFTDAYPADRRAADALYNAAVIRRDAGDAAGAARAFLAFATRFPRDARVGEANAARIAALRATGDTASIGAELSRLCLRPPPAMAATCADRAGAAAFAAGMARWDAYVALRLEIKSRAQLTRAGVDAASAPKLQAYRAITRSFAQAIASGAPMWVAAGSFQSGLAHWYYGLFLRDVVLPADLTDAQRTGAQQGAAQQAQQYFDLALKTWTALVEKADADKFDNDWVARARAALRGEGIPPREKAP